MAIQTFSCSELLISKATKLALRRDCCLSLWLRPLLELHILLLSFWRLGYIAALGLGLARLLLGGGLEIRRPAEGTTTAVEVSAVGGLHAVLTHFQVEFCLWDYLHQINEDFIRNFGNEVLDGVEALSLIDVQEDPLGDLPDL